MSSDISPPRFLSIEFHAHFFPQLLWNRLRRMKWMEQQGTSFPSTLGKMILLALSLILATVGIPLGLKHGSATGWVLTFLGGGGVLAISIASVAPVWRKEPNYDDFLTGFFLFFVAAGFFSGISIGMGMQSLWIGGMASLGGLIAGYASGILAGLHLQRLGWIALLLNMMAAFVAIIGSGTFLVMVLNIVVF